MSASSFRLSSATAVAVVLATGVLTTTSLTAQTGNGTPIGHFDVAGCDVIAGWAADPNSPNQPIQVHVYAGGQAGLGGTMLGAWNADVYRGDVAASGMAGNGVHGFYFPVPNNLKDNQPHQIFVYAINMAGTPGANALLVGSPKTIQCAPVPIGGQDEQVSCDNVTGWVCDPNNLSPTSVHFYVNGPAGQGALAGGATADKPREALIGYYCGGTTNHGYSFSVPQQYRDGQPHFVYAYGIDSNNVPLSNSQLGNSPRIFQCNPTAVSSSSSSSSVPFSSSSSVSSSAQSVSSVASTPQCSDLADNDNDGATDSQDPGCWANTLDPMTYNPSYNNEAAAGLLGNVDLGISASAIAGQPSAYSPGANGMVKLSITKAGTPYAYHVYYLTTLPPELSHAPGVVQTCQATGVANQYKCFYPQQAFTMGPWAANGLFKVNPGQCGKTVTATFAVGADNPDNNQANNTTSFNITLSPCPSSTSSSSSSVSSSSSSSAASSVSSASSVSTSASSASSTASSTSSSPYKLGIRVVPGVTAPVYPNTFFSYDVYVKNNGQQAVSNVTVQMTIPPDATFWPNYNDPNGNGGTQYCTTDGNNVLCPLLNITLQPGMEQLIQLTFKALTCTTQSTSFSYQASATGMMGALGVSSDTAEGTIVKNCGTSGSTSSSTSSSSSSSSSSAMSVSSQASSSSVPVSCIAQCPDGFQYPTCTASGPINYLVDPCLTHMGSSSSTSSPPSSASANTVLYTLQYHAGQQTPITPGQNGTLDISVINHGPAVSIHPYALVTFSSGLTSMLPASACTATGQPNQFKCIFPDLVDEQAVESTIPFQVNAGQCGQTPSITVAVGSDNATVPLSANTSTFTVATTPCPSNQQQVNGDITMLFVGLKNTFNIGTGQAGFDANFDYDGDGWVSQADFNTFRLLAQCPANPPLLSVVRIYTKLTQGFRNTFGLSTGMPGFKAYYDFDKNGTIDLADFTRLRAIIQNLINCLVQGFQNQGMDAMMSNAQ